MAVLERKYMKTIGIMGTSYCIQEDDSIIKEDADGTCSKYDKVIKIRPIEKLLSDNDSDYCKQRCYNETCRHELIHAMFFESGLYCYSEDEVLVDWIASQFPKMAELFDSMNCSE